MSDRSLLEQAKDHYKIAEEWWADNRKHALEDIKFRIPGQGNQWPDDIKRKREAAKLPCVEVDKINQYIRQVVNDGRQNRPSVKVSPEEGGDVEVAEAFGGIIRAICDRSNADEAFDTALDHAAGNGFGFFRVLTEYAGEKTFNQEIKVCRVRNPLAVLLGPHYKADASDADFGFFIDEVPKERFSKLYPKAKVTDWSSDGFSEGWITDQAVRVCEYFYKVQESQNLLLLEDGTTATEEEYWEAADRKPIVDRRDIPVTKIKWCRMTGAEILEERDWAGKYIPIIPVYGNEIDVEGKVVYFGLVRPAKDGQRLYNFSRSAFAQRVAMTPKAPWLAEVGQMEGFEEIWEIANDGSITVLPYKAVSVEGHPVPPPSRISPTDVPGGFVEDMQLAEHDIQASMGMYSASIGERSNEKSGKAILARQREGDTATFHYQDNLNRAIRHLGRILVDLIPKIYDSRRVVRILGEDGSVKTAEVDPELGRPIAELGDKTIYNLGAGTYDVTIAAGPSYTTKRQEAAEAMIELTRANPRLWETHGDLIVQSQDWPNADKFAERSKRALPPEFREDEDGETVPVAELNALRQQAEAAIAEREQVIRKMQEELESKRAEAEAKLKDSDTKAYEARTERMQAIAPAITPELVQQIAQQTALQVLEAMRSSTPQQPEPAPAGFFMPEGA